MPKITMDVKNEKALLDELKNFDINKLYQKGSYIDFTFQNEWMEAYILKVHPNNKYDISFLIQPGVSNLAAEISNNFFGFFTENSFKNDIERRNICFNKELLNMNPRQIVITFKVKLTKANINLNYDNNNKEKNIIKKNDKSKNDNNNIKNEQKKDEKEFNKENKDKSEINNDQKRGDVNNKENNNNEDENKKINNKTDIKEDNSLKEKENKIIENKDIINNEKLEENKDISTAEEHEKDLTTKEQDTSSQNIITTDINTKESLNSSENNLINIDKEKENKNTQNKNLSDSKEKEPNKIIPNSLTSIDKNGNPVNISGYYTFQFLSGFLIDCIEIIYRELYSRVINPPGIELFNIILDTSIYIAEFVKDNLDKLKSIMSNRKLIINSRIHAILASFEYILVNLNEIYQYNLSQYEDIDNKLKIFVNICYLILIESQKFSALPMRLLILLIRFVCEEKDSIIDYEPNDIYKVFLNHIENLNETELKNIKSNELMKKKCIYIINIIFRSPKETFINACYYSYLINCLKCNNLEKKMNALNDISEIIDSITKDEIDKNFFDFFIKKNKILDIFFEESVHEEILKRASCIFKYLATFNKLEDEVLDKLVKEQTKNDSMKKILCDVISELPSEKKNLTFNHLIKNLNFDEKKTDIEYISRLTQSCFSSLENDNYQKMIEKLSKKAYKDVDSEEEEENADNLKEDFNNNETRNYYGLTLLFDYIIKDFNKNKPYDKNNVNFAIDAFYHIIQLTSYIEVKDVFYFFDLVFDNIKSNEKHNSVVQSLYKKIVVKII